MGFKLTTLVVIGTDCTDRSNYHMITTMTVSFPFEKNLCKFIEEYYGTIFNKSGSAILIFIHEVVVLVALPYHTNSEVFKKN